MERCGQVQCDSDIHNWCWPCISKGHVKWRKHGVGVGQWVTVRVAVRRHRAYGQRRNVHHLSVSVASRLNFGNYSYLPNSTEFIKE